MPTFIPCGPCAVRSWRSGDERSLARHADDRDVWLNLRDRFPHPYTRDAAAAWVRHAAAQDPETEFAIDVDGEAVGGIGLVPRADVERCAAELGYWVGKRHWGRGIATAAIRAVTAHAFGALALERVFAVPFAPNAASVRALEKAGFVREGVMRRSAIKDGRVLDQVLYAAVRTDPAWGGAAPAEIATRLEHVAIWTHDVERLRAFYERHFGARAGALYRSRTRPGFTSYFLVLPGGGARLELMSVGDLAAAPGAPAAPAVGLAHVALAVGSRAAVDALTARLAADGVRVVGAPRQTGDGYYESVVEDPDGNVVEITA